MECWRTGVQLPPAPPNTGGCLDHSRPLETSIYAGSSTPPPFPHLVSDGLKRSPLGHKSGTSDTNKAHSLNPVDRASLSTKHLGTPECHLFRKNIFEGHPQLALPMASSYLEIAKQKGYVEANQSLLSLNDRLIVKDLNLSASIDALKQFAANKAAYMEILGASYGNDHQTAYQACCDYVSAYGFTPPKPSEHAGLVSSCINRMSCPRWWKKKVFTKQRRTIEAVARDIGLIHKKQSAYSSKITQIKRANQKALAEKFLENTFLVNGDQQVFSLKELSATSVSNPEIRRAELMTRIAGFEIVADQLDHCGEFYTITTPSKMHARLNKNGGRNPKYDGTTPREANEYLCDVWKKIRAKLHRENINIYGFRVAEPNHDGTPHWHMLFFMKPSVKNRVRSIMKSYALEDSKHEKGAKDHRFKAIPIDKSKGSAAGYIAKYIAKNIDGSNLESDLIGNDAKDTAKAIDSWASCWGIRQFQQIGGPSVTVWRELRRLVNSDTDVSDLDDSLTIVEAASAAAASDWAAYVMVMGGVEMRKSERPIKPFYEQPDYINYETGEIIEEGLTAYGDPVAPRIKGLSFPSDTIITHLHNWKKITDSDKKNSLRSEGSEPSRLFSSLPEGQPWTSINNCTHTPVH